MIGNNCHWLETKITPYGEKNIPAVGFAKPDW